MYTKSPQLFFLVVLVSVTHFPHTTQSANIIPLSSWQEPQTTATIRNDARDRAMTSQYYIGNPGYLQYSTTQNKEPITEEELKPIERRSFSINNETTVTDTEIELFGCDRKGRVYRHAVSTVEPRKNKNKEGLMAKILPMLVMPFLISSSLIPMMLTSLKFMLLKSLFVGKIAIVLLALNALWKSDNRGGVYSHNVNYDYGHEQKELHRNHYGYNGDEEYGVYVNRRSERVTRFR